MLQTLAMGALTIAEFGSTEQKNMILPEVITGKCILTGAFQEWGINDPYSSSLKAEETNGSWSLTGSKPAVPAANIANYIVAPAITDAGDIASSSYQQTNHPSQSQIVQQQIGNCTVKLR